MIPLLGLLPDNYYVILDTELYPTDGNGHLFWNVPNSGERLPGACLFYRGDGEWGLSRPHFTIATQSIEKLCKDRVEYYRKHPNCRAIAYYMDGYMTALIDGHHKAMAAAMEHKKVNALVIMPCYTIRCRKNDEKLMASYIQAGDIRFAFDEYELEEIPNYIGEKISLEDMKYIQSLIPKVEAEFSYENDELVSSYPDADEMADIDEIGTLIKALGGLKHERLWEIADYFFAEMFLPVIS